MHDTTLDIFKTKLQEIWIDGSAIAFQTHHTADQSLPIITLQTDQLQKAFGQSFPVIPKISHEGESSVPFLNRYLLVS